jgi:oxygen-independent coproporphyrinogen-3 oxidase
MPMTNALRAHLARPVPRYTSYPTAVQFHPGVTGTAYRRWLEDLDPSVGTSIYVHVPFCRRLCHYCGCNTNIVARYEPVADFLESVELELAHTASALRGTLSYRHLHFGGGTPTILDPADFRRLMRAIDRHFRRSPEAELAVEIDPRTLTAEMAETLADCGINRASLGVQDFDPSVQAAINRIQPFELVAETVERLRRVGITELNFDLIYGLPKQSLDSFRATVDQAASLEPARLALFGYAHVPWMKRHQKLLERHGLPDGVLREALSRETSGRLVELGFVPVGLDHFARAGDPLARAARAGTLRRNFQGYTTDPADTLLAFGPSGISRLPQGYAQAEANVRLWHEAVRAHRHPIVRGVALTAQDRLRADVIEALMCRQAADLQAIADRHGAGDAEFVFDREIDALRSFVDAGAATLDRARLTITRAGHLYLRPIAALFDEYLTSEATRHSRAV